MHYLRLLNQTIFYTKPNFKTKKDYLLEELDLSIAKIENRETTSKWGSGGEDTSTLMFLQFKIKNSERNFGEFVRFYSVTSMDNFVRDFPIIEVKGIMYYTKALFVRINYTYQNLIMLTPI